MKKRQYIILAVIAGIIILIGSAIAMRSKGGKKEDERKPKEAKYVKAKKAVANTYPIVIRANGRIGSSRKIMVIAEVQGKLKQGDVNLKAGTSFREGQLLFVIDDTEAALKVQARRSGFLTMLAAALADIKIDFPKEFPMWENFFQAVDVTHNLPDLPNMSTTKGKTYLASRNILGEYYAIRADEALLRKYRVYAPFNGNIMEVFTEYGTVVNPGVQIARILQTGNMEVEVSVDVFDSKFLSVGDTAILQTGDQREPVLGKIERIGQYVNANTQSVDVFIGVYEKSTDRIYDGMYAQVEMRAGDLSDVMRIPRRAVFNQNEIYTVSDTLLIRSQVKVIRKDNEFAYFTGVDSGAVMVIEPLSNPTDSMVVKTIMKDE